MSDGLTERVAILDELLRAPKRDLEVIRERVIDLLHVVDRLREVSNVDSTLDSQ
jgi:hypothetical protein